MCRNCKASPMGIQRQAALDEAVAACQQANVNPGIHGFIVRHAYQGQTPGGNAQYTDEQRAVLDQYNAAQQAMKKLHEDYVWALARQGVEEARARGVAPLSITHADKR